MGEVNNQSDGDEIPWDGCFPEDNIIHGQNCECCARHRSLEENNDNDY